MLIRYEGVGFVATPLMIGTGPGHDTVQVGVQTYIEGLVLCSRDNRMGPIDVGFDQNGKKRLQSIAIDWQISLLQGGRILIVL